MIWSVWWVWLIGAAVLSVVEVIAPGYIFLGFALGAGVTGLTLLVGGPLGAWLASSLPAVIAFFAVVSLLAWIAVRRVAGIRQGQIKTFDRDINED